jgi:glutamate N-acetyltransferase/amino-acid N-acetyltransferase
MESWHLARGYRYAGVHSGLRPEPERLDLALIVSDRPAAAAGVFTQNCVCAAPVHICRERLPTQRARGIVICSGNANACTGQQGLDDARRMTELAGEAVGASAEQMLVCSTGVIGRLLPMEVIAPGIALAGRDLADGPVALERAARAILTTDTRIKVSTQTMDLEARAQERTQLRLTGFAKGAAMIGPNMATMLAFVLTDAAIDPADLAGIAREVADRTFNCVRVEGHTSTNDSLIFLANGEGLPLKGSDLTRFQVAADAVCARLAREIAADAEGASHLVTIEVQGTRTVGEARAIARTVADSALVKTALFGADPNWGRIVSAAGYSGVAFREDELSLWLGDTPLYSRGTPVPFDAAAVSAYMRSHRELTLRLVFTLGSAQCTVYTCDLTHDYVRLNAEYTT